MERNCLTKLRLGIPLALPGLGALWKYIRHEYSHHRGLGGFHSNNCSIICIDGSTWSNSYHGAWHFQDIIGSTLADSGSKNYHGTGVGGPTLASGQVGNSISLTVLTILSILVRMQVIRVRCSLLPFWTKISGGDNNPRLFGNKSQSAGTVGWEIYKY